MRMRLLSALALAAAPLLLAALLHLAAGVGATPAAPDAGYSLLKWVVAGGGGHSGAGGFSLDGTAGQAAAGHLAGSDYTLQAGFWSACLADAPVPPAPAVSRAGSDVALAWPAAPEDAAYQVWVSANPYFAPEDPGGVTPIVTDLTSFTDPGAAASLANHFYVVRGLNRCSAASGNSARKGEFTFGLTPGA